MPVKLRACACVFALAVASACASESTTAPTSSAPAKSAAPSNATIQARLNQVLSNFVSTLNTANSHKSSPVHATLPAAPRALFAPRGVTCNANGSQCQVFEQWDTREACPAGGT